MKRRDFLHAIGAAGAAAALSPLSAISLEDDWYVNARLGLSLRKPAGWHFVSIEDFEKQMDEQQLEFENDEALLRRLRELSGTPILAVNKYNPAPDDVVCPTIQIHAEPPDPGADDLELEALKGVTALRWFHREYEPEAPPSVIQLGSQTAVTWNYTYRLGEGEGMLVRARYYIVHGVRAHYSLGMAGPAEGTDTSDAEFEAVLGSIVFG